MTIVLCKTLCDDFFQLQRGIFCCLGEYLQIISNQESDDDDLLKGGGYEGGEENSPPSCT